MTMHARVEPFFMTLLYVVATISPALCRHEMGTRVDGFLRPLADGCKLRCHCGVLHSAPQALAEVPKWAAKSDEIA